MYSYMRRHVLVRTKQQNNQRHESAFAYFRSSLHGVSSSLSFSSLSPSNDDIHIHIHIRTDDDDVNDTNSMKTTSTTMSSTAKTRSRTRIRQGLLGMDGRYFSRMPTTSISSSSSSSSSSWSRSSSNQPRIISSSSISASTIANENSSTKNDDEVDDEDAYSKLQAIIRQYESIDPSTNNNDHKKKPMDHDHGRTTTTSIIHQWSMYKLGREYNNIYNIHQMIEIVYDIALRLQREGKLVQQLILCIRRDEVEEGEAQRRQSSFRPYWWTISHEERWKEELKSVLKQLTDMERLHDDTYQQCIHVHQLLVSLQEQQEQEKKQHDDDIYLNNNDGDEQYRQQKRQQQQQKEQGKKSYDLSASQVLYILNNTMKELYARHSLTMEPMVDVVLAYRNYQPPTTVSSTSISSMTSSSLPTSSTSSSASSSEEDIMVWVHAFLQSRLGIQLLCDHVVQLYKQQKVPNQTTAASSSSSSSSSTTSAPASTTSAMKSASTGAIAWDTNVVTIINSAISEVKQLCEAHYLTSPPVHVIVVPAARKNGNDNDNDDDHIGVDEIKSHGNVTDSIHSIHGTTIRPWLQYALVELLKNAMIVTIQRNRRRRQEENGRDDNNDDNNDDDDDDDNTDAWYPIYIQIQESLEYIIIQIFDQGGGIIEHDGNHDNDDDNEQSLVIKNEKTIIKNWFSFPSINNDISSIDTIDKNSNNDNNNDKIMQKMMKKKGKKKKWDRLDDQQTYAMTRSPLQGLGVGLHTSRRLLDFFSYDNKSSSTSSSLSSYDQKGQGTKEDTPEQFSPTSFLELHERLDTTTSTTTTSTDTNTNTIPSLNLKSGMTATIRLPKEQQQEEEKDDYDDDESTTRIKTTRKSRYLLERPIVH